MPQPKIGLSMLYLLGEPFDKMVKQLSKTPTETIEVVDDGYHALNQKRVQMLRKAATENNLKFSVHAPFADINVASPSKHMLKSSMKRLCQSMQSAHKLNAYLWVFHPGCKSGISSFYPGAEWKQNLSSIQELYKTAKDLGLEIAMENLPEKYNFIMKTPEDFNRFYTESGLDKIGIVLDTGHANLEGQIYPFLQQLPNKIVHVHISDNHGVVDEHLGLGYGNIDWPQFTKTLKSTGFARTVLTESVFNVLETVQKLKQLFP
jgi:sugar phosphate isomerase/epimerase